MREAEQDALDSVAEPNEAVNRLTELAAEVHALAAIARPEYEYTGPRTVGGVTSANPYPISVPFSGPCEVCVVAATGATATSSTLVLSSEANGVTIVNNSGVITQTLDGSQPFLFPISLFGNESVFGGGIWFPLSGASALYVFVGGSSPTGGLYVTLQFRRRINPAGVPQFGYP